MAADNDSQGGNVRQAIGGLRANARRLFKGRRRTDERPGQGLAEADARRKRKSDLLFYAFVAMGIVIIAEGYAILILLIIILERG